ncbi:hypothetical protein MHU86_12470 [Fragilaria crotonensis]|nr:hypothetical protein MHU86_12470 [Fragilaria crotonensis]
MSSDRRSTEKSRLLLSTIAEGNPSRSNGLGCRPWYLIIAAILLGIFALLSIGSLRIKTRKGKEPHAPNNSVVIQPALHDTSSNVLNGCNATVLLMRHCEKENIREHCSSVGFERSDFLVSLFGPKARWPVPSFLFAENPTGRNNPATHNFREIETLTPMATEFHLNIDASYDTHHTADLAAKMFQLMDNGELCGKMAVASWKHSDIATLANVMGCTNANGCPTAYPSNMYDEVWELNFVYHKSTSLATKHGGMQPSGVWKVTALVEFENFNPLSFGK